MRPLPRNLPNVATITTKPSQLRDFLHKTATELLPLYRGLPGLVAFTAAKMGDATAVCYGIWHTREEAEQAVKTSDRWMKEGSGTLIDSLHNSIGALPFLAVTGEIAASSPPRGGRQSYRLAVPSYLPNRWVAALSGRSDLTARLVWKRREITHGTVQSFRSVLHSPGLARRNHCRGGTSPPARMPRRLAPDRRSRRLRCPRLFFSR